MKKPVTIILILAAILAGLLVGRGCANRPLTPSSPTPETGPSANQAHDWTCSMHPQIRQPKPGKCPLCGMDLIPVQADASTGHDTVQRTSFSPNAVALAEIETAPVERRRIEKEVRLVGKVAFDESRLAYVTARVPGRIDRLYADYVGMPVKVGDHLADFYSPSLVAAQQELILTLNATNLPGYPERLDAIRERLRLWGLTHKQIADIEHGGKVSDHITFFSPIGGIVVEKTAREGLYAETGTQLFTLADMTRLWLKLDAYESDLVWLRYAQQVEFRVEAFPGRAFTGTVAFIAPVLDPVTRTVNVRVNIANADGSLKPGMFAHAVVRAELSGSGTAIGPDLHGKWICPMHPEVVREASGTCDICGMPLARAETLGYAMPTDNSPPLVIPATAPLLTGTRAVVYAAVPGKPGTFEGREVELGPRAGDCYLVRKGLHEGELVVVSGAFKIDSSLQIQAKPSMMNPAPAPAKVPDAFRQQLADLLNPVLAITDALAKDDLPSAKIAVGQASNALARVDRTAVTGKTPIRWMGVRDTLAKRFLAMSAAPDLDTFRSAFAPLAAVIADTARTFGPLRESPIYEFHCPMALNNRGANWLQADSAIRNPFFGPAMLKCGELVAPIPATVVPPTSGGSPDE